MTIVLAMGSINVAARADGSTPHGHAKEPPKSAAPAQGTMGHGMMDQGMMDQGMMGQGMMGQGMLQMPQMNPARGRELFASKGCVVCHSINGVGGTDATALDATTMPRLMNPFEFTAKMWRGAEAMIYLQRDELGEQIEFSGDELADIIAFVHHHEEQAKFSEADIPPRIKGLMHHMGEEQSEEHKKEHETDKPKE